MCRNLVSGVGQQLCGLNSVLQRRPCKLLGAIPSVLEGKFQQHPHTEPRLNACVHPAVHRTASLLLSALTNMGRVLSQLVHEEPFTTTMIFFLHEMHAQPACSFLQCCSQPTRLQ